MLNFLICLVCTLGFLLLPILNILTNAPCYNINLAKEILTSLPIMENSPHFNHEVLYKHHLPVFICKNSKSYRQTKEKKKYREKIPKIIQTTEICCIFLEKQSQLHGEKVKL